MVVSTGDGATPIIATNVAFDSPPVGPVVATANTDGVTRSLTSTSVTVSVSVAINPMLDSVRLAEALSLAPTVMAGASFVPVIVTVTSCSTVPPLPSSAVTVKVSVAVWPAARYCVALLATL